MTEEVVYYGHGCRERAWVCRPKAKGAGGGGHRSREHAAWCDELMEVGLQPGQWVKILRQGLSKEEARAIEQQMIHDHPTMFNKDMGLGNLKLTKKLVQTIRDERDRLGTYYSQLGPKHGLSVMTAYRICNQEVRTID